jgi:hypothetical protein
MSLRWAWEREKVCGIDERNRGLVARRPLLDRYTVFTVDSGRYWRLLESHDPRS